MSAYGSYPTAYRSGAAPYGNAGFQRPVPYRPGNVVPIRPPVPANDNFARTFPRSLNAASRTAGFGLAARGLLRFAGWVGVALTIADILWWLYQQWQEGQPNYVIPSDYTLVTTCPGVSPVIASSLTGGCGNHFLGMTPTGSLPGRPINIGTWGNLTYYEGPGPDGWNGDLAEVWTRGSGSTNAEGGDFPLENRPGTVLPPVPEPDWLPWPDIPWPDAIPRPGLPAPDPVPWPVWANPLPANPFRSPVESSSRGYSVPQEVPAPVPGVDFGFGWDVVVPEPNPYSDPTAEPGPTLVSDPLSGSAHAPRPGAEQNPGRHPRSRRPRERKFRYAFHGPAAKIIGATTEGLDIANALWDALPDWVKRQYASQRTNKRTGEKFWVSSQSRRLQALLEHWQDIDVVEAIRQVGLNQIEDFAFGKTGSKIQRAYGAAGDAGYHNRPFGITIGPAI